MPDQTPEARLAAALHKAEMCWNVDGCSGPESHSGDVRVLLAADPPLARHLALGAAVERLPDDESWDIVYERPDAISGDIPPFGVIVWPRGVEMGAERRGRADTLTAAITEALGAMTDWQAIKTATAMPEMYALLVEAREELNESARALHSIGGVRDHWFDPRKDRIGDGPCDFDVCEDTYCEDARSLLSRLPQEALR